MQRADFDRAMAKLTATWAATLPEATLASWYQDLYPFDAADLAVTVQRLATTSERRPSLAHLVAGCREQRAERALQEEAEKRLESADWNPSAADPEYVQLVKVLLRHMFTGHIPKVDWQRLFPERPSDFDPAGNARPATVQRLRDYVAVLDPDYQPPSSAASPRLPYAEDAPLLEALT